MHDQFRIVGTAGHIDHGKSALVQALTGTDPDRLQEEQERGITIDLGFAHLDFDAALRVGFIDVPGHERFVKNMLAGIGGIDAVLLVVAADESIMPQTREHLAICELLGIRQGVVALTKTDLVDAEITELVGLEVRDLLAGTALAAAPIVPTSARSGAGIDALREALKQLLAEPSAHSAARPARLPIDRVFTVRGFGTVATGTLLSGTIKTADALELLPAGTRVTVRGVQAYGERVDVARAGQRTAVNLQGVDVDALDRGDLLVAPDSMATTHLIDARLTMLPGNGLEPLQRVRFHHGAAEILGRVAILDGAEITPGGNALVQLRLESPYACVPGDRFVIRRYSPMITIGGGRVVDNLPTKHRAGDAATLAFLAAVDEASAAQRLTAVTEAAGHRGIDERALRHRMGLAVDTLRDLVSERAGAGSLIVARAAPLLVVAPAALARLEAAARDILAAYHQAHPLRAAMPKRDLAAGLPRRIPEAVIDTLIARLGEQGRVRIVDGDIALAGHEVALTAEQRSIRAALLAWYESAGWAPPAPGEAWQSLGIDASEGEKVLRMLLRDGDLVRLGDDLIFLASHLAGIVDEVRQRYEPGMELSVAAFKDFTGVSRKHAIPLLEYLDQHRVTRRAGDQRVVL